MRYIALIVLGIVTGNFAIGYAQNLNIRTDEKSEFEKFVDEIKEDFNNFRRETMLEFVEFVKNPWKEFDETPPVPMPEEKPIPPVIINEDDLPVIEDNELLIDNVIKPVIDEEQPQPIEPIEEIPEVHPVYHTFKYFGTTDKVRINQDYLPILPNLSENSIAKALQILSESENDNMIYDCLEIRDRRNLSDWAYLQMLNTLANNIYKERPNEAQLLLAYLFLQSGYKIRLGTDGNSLYMLYASKHMIFDQPSFSIDDDYFYGIGDLPSRLSICEAAFPNEKSISLYINSIQDFDRDISPKRTIASNRYNEMKFDLSVNKNLLNFYSTYPTSMYNGDFMTRWAMYAHTPLDPVVKTDLYPLLKEKLKDKSELEAVNMLLNFIQTGLTYEYDDVVWGHDRAFFAEESLYYPFCDCEDRSILLSRIVKDVLGLNCILVYYPGHLAAAVEFSDNSVMGDYIMLEGRKYIIADPTYIGAPVGYTMPEMDNNGASVILID